MSPTAAVSRFPRPAAAIGCVVALVAGCGSSTPASEAVPGLETRLSAVDRAIADHDFDQARRQIQRLVSMTVAARDAGDLDSDQADPILAAAASLTTALPRRHQPNRPPSPQPDVTAPQPEPDQHEGTTHEEHQNEQHKRQEEQQKRRDEPAKQREKQQKKLEKEQQKQEKGRGHGHSNEHGPNDGHGN